MLQRTALITGASQGLGLALAEALAHQGWQLLITARTPERLLAAQEKLAAHTKVIAISGDVRDEVHLLQLPQTLGRQQWKLDLVVNNASVLGASPLVNLLDLPIAQWHELMHANVIAPVSVLQHVRPYLNERPVIVNISSDAGVQHYPTWGPYGSSKAALNHISATLAIEQPDWQVYAFDPGDMRTTMHQAAFPGEDISDRPLPHEQAVPRLLALLPS